MLLRDKRNGNISQEIYDVKYRKYSLKVKELEKIETDINNATLTQMIKKDRLSEIIEILNNTPEDLHDPNMMKLLVEFIKVIDKHTIEFQLIGGKSITKQI